MPLVRDARDCGGLANKRFLNCSQFKRKNTCRIGRSVNAGRTHRTVYYMRDQLSWESISLTNWGSQVRTLYPAPFSYKKRDASGASLEELRMVGAVKVKCIRAWSEGWSPRKYAWVAQQVEQRTENPRVGGSIPSPGTRAVLYKCGQLYNKYKSKNCNGMIDNPVALRA